MQNIKRVLGLSLALAKAEFKLRNEGSYLGLLWYLLNPLLTFLLLLLVFSDRLGNNIPQYPLYLLVGIIMFNFFQRATREATKIIHRHVELIKSVKFPLEVFAGSIVLMSIFSHFFEMVILAAFLLFFNIPLANLVFYPLLLCVFSIFVYGFTLILSSLVIYFIDLDNIWVFVSHLVWLGTPVFYAIEGQKRLAVVNLFNPLYYFITIARDLIVYNRLSPLWMIIGALGYALLTFITGVFIFSKLKFKFAEMI